MHRLHDESQSWLLSTGAIFVGLGVSKKDACRVFSSPLRMAPRILFDSFGRWRPARGGNFDEVGAVCSMRGKHSWTHRAPHQNGTKNEAPPRERRLQMPRSCQQSKCARCLFRDRAQINRNMERLGLPSARLPQSVRHGSGKQRKNSAHSQQGDTKKTILLAT